MSTTGIIGFAVSAIGMTLNAHHRHAAQVVFIVGNVVWIVFNASLGLWEPVACQCLSVILNLRTFVVWMSENRVSESATGDYSI